MKEDFASIVNFIMKKVGEQVNATAYFENIKSGFRLPAIYFPKPECVVQKDTLSHQYQDSNMQFVQVFHLTDEDAYSLADKIARALFEVGCYIPVISEEGGENGLFFHVNVKKVSRIDDCVAQIQLSWNYRSYFCEEKTKANNINVNLIMEGEEYGESKN